METGKWSSISFLEHNSKPMYLSFQLKIPAFKMLWHAHIMFLSVQFQCTEIFSLSGHTTVITDTKGVGVGGVGDAREMYIMTTYCFFFLQKSFHCVRVCSTSDMFSYCHPVVSCCHQTKAAYPSYRQEYRSVLIVEFGVLIMLKKMYYWSP